MKQVKAGHPLLILIIVPFLIVSKIKSWDKRGCQISQNDEIVSTNPHVWLCCECLHGYNARTKPSSLFHSVCPLDYPQVAFTYEMGTRLPSSALYI